MSRPKLPEEIRKQLAVISATKQRVRHNNLKPDEDMAMLDSFQIRSREEVGALMGMSRANVFAIERRALWKIRWRMKPWYDRMNKEISEGYR